MMIFGACGDHHGTKNIWTSPPFTATSVFHIPYKTSLSLTFKRRSPAIAFLGKQDIFTLEDDRYKRPLHAYTSGLLAQSQLTELFDVKVPAISKRACNILVSGEHSGSSTVSKMERVQVEGGRCIKRNQVQYNLDMIISIGYRVNSAKATQFRIWAITDHGVAAPNPYQSRIGEPVKKMRFIFCNVFKTITHGGRE